MPSDGEETDSRRSLSYVPSTLKWFVTLAGVLVVIGILNVYSTTFYMNINSGENPYGHITRHLVFLGVGIATAVMAANCSSRFIRKHDLAWCLFTILGLLLVFVAGRTVNGATRWIQIGPLSVQPSEIAKVTALIWCASCLSVKMDKGIRTRVFSTIFGTDAYSRRKSMSERIMYFKPLFLPLIMAVFILKQPDMGTAGMTVIFPGLLYVLAGMPKREIVLGLGFAALLFIVLAIAEPYRWDRIVVLWDPFSMAEDLGYQTVQSLIAVGSGGLMGQGPGEGMSKFLFLPEQYTDFAYAVWSQEFGFIGSFIVLLLYVALLWCGFLTASKLKYTYEALLVYGLSMLIAVQGITNIAMVIGCFPVTGIPLPFISYGGTSLVVNLAAVGLIWGSVTQSMARADMEERRYRIAAMEGHAGSLGNASGAVFRPRSYR